MKAEKISLQKCLWLLLYSACALYSYNLQATQSWSIPTKLHVPGLGNVTLDTKRNSSETKEEEQEDHEDDYKGEETAPVEQVDLDYEAELEEGAIVAGAFEQSVIKLGPLELNVQDVGFNPETQTLSAFGEVSFFGCQTRWFLDGFAPGETSVLLGLELEKPLIPGMCMLHNLYLIIGGSVLSLEGDVSLTLPGGKKISSRLSAILDSPTSVTFSGVADFSSITKHIPLPIVQDFSQMRAELAISKREGVRVQAFFAEDKPIIPFKGIPGLEDIKIENISLGLDSKKKALFVQGATKIVNLAVLGRFELGSHIFFIAELSDDWKISDIAPQAQKTFLDEMKLPNGRLIISSKRYYDERLGLQITKGINVIADFPLNEFLLNFVKDERKLKLLKSIPPFMVLPDRVQVYGSLGFSLADLALSMNLFKGEIPILAIPNGPSIKAGNLALYIDGRGPTVGGKLNILVKPTPQDELLLFSGSLDLNRLMLNVAGSMVGRWQNPLGLASLLKIEKDKLALEDCAIEVGYDLKRVLSTISTMVSGGGTVGAGAGTVGAGAGTVATAGAAAGATVGAGTVTGGGAVSTGFSALSTITSNITGLLPNNFGITGGLKVGDAVAKMAVQLSTDIDNTTLMGKLVKQVKKEDGTAPEETMVKLIDIVTFANDLGIAIPKQNVPDIGFSGDVLFAPKGTKIGQVYIDPGITFKGHINIPNIFRCIDSQAPKTFNAFVDMSLSFEGIRAKGTISKITIPNVIEFTGAGMDQQYGTQDDGPTLDAELSLQKQQFFFSGKVKFLNEQLALLKAESDTQGSFDMRGFYFSTKTFLFNGKVKVELRARTVGESLAQVRDFQVHGEFQDDFRAFIEKEVLQSLEALTKGVSQSLSKAQQDMKQAEKRLTEAQNKVDGLNRQIKQKKKEHDAIKINGWPWEIVKKGAQKAKLGVEIAALWIAHKAAIGALEIAKKAVSTTRGSFALTEKGIGLAGAAGRDILKGVSGGFSIRKAAISFSLKELLPPSSTLPIITFDAVVLGKELKGQKIHYDLKRPDKFVADLIEILKNFLK